MYCCGDVLLQWCIVVVMFCCGDVLLWWCIVVMYSGCDVLRWWCIVAVMYCCGDVLLWCVAVVMYCCGDVLLQWCIVVVMFCCGDVLLWWCTVVVMYCCDVLLWCIVVVMYCCSDVLLLWCCDVVMITFSKFRGTEFRLTIKFPLIITFFFPLRQLWHWAVSCDLCSCLSDCSWTIVFWLSWIARSCQLRNGLKENEVQRRYAKAYETNYMTEQLAKLVMTVSTQVQKLRSRTPNMRKHHETSYADWPCK